MADLTATRPELARQLESFRTLEDVFGWLRGELQRVEMVAQDEFSQDLFLALPPGPEYLVFSATWLGRLTAVAVFSHRPSSEDLLQWRLARGWRPMASALVGGDRILGYAEGRV